MSHLASRVTRLCMLDTNGTNHTNDTNAVLPALHPGQIAYPPSLNAFATGSTCLGRTLLEDSIGGILGLC